MLVDRGTTESNYEDHLPESGLSKDPPEGEVKINR